MNVVWLPLVHKESYTELKEKLVKPNPVNKETDFR